MSTLSSKNIPKVVSKVADFKEGFEITDYFLSRSGPWDWSPRIFKSYPDLKKELNNIQDSKKRTQIALKYFQNFYQDNEAIFVRYTQLFQNEWNKINDKIMIALSEVIEIEWNKNEKEFIADISFCPVCPRFIKERRFYINFRAEINDSIGTAIHEILHFIYFEKWKEVFPNSKEEEFEHPHIIWQLSEMVPRVILNEKRIQKVFSYEHDSYKEYENVVIKGKPLLQYLQEIYDNKENFEDFLKKSYNFVIKNKTIIEKL